MPFDPRWLSVIGLALDIVGAIVLSMGLIVTKRQAMDLSTPYSERKILGSPVTHPQTLDRLRQSRNAKIGLAFLVVGFLLQMTGTWPR